MRKVFKNDPVSSSIWSLTVCAYKSNPSCNLWLKIYCSKLNFFTYVIILLHAIAPIFVQILLKIIFKGRIPESFTGALNFWGTFETQILRNFWQVLSIT